MQKIKPLTAGWLLVIIYCVGIIGFLFDETRPIMRSLIWVNILTTLIVLLAYHKKWSKEFALASMFVAGCGFLIEVIGVNTGWIFGYYQYGPTLGHEVWNTPVMMSANWLLSIYISRQIAEMLSKDIVVVSAIGAALMVLLDFFIEPFAIKNGMWQWSDIDVPLQNYIGWFVCGFILHYLFIKSVKFSPNKLSLPVYLIQLGFFAALYILER